jgi:HD-GYP domain-containing protein (c-di-GMP phosphodiesterase class II)
MPVTEQLLADKPEHIVPHDKPALAPDNPWGFVVKPPPHKFNLGEIYNLSIGRGTLTAEDRFHINDHIVQTIIMLEALPFPKTLKRVPEWAGGHHEKMDGTGYPKGLKREQMSIPARIMAIADIFEALTARDRPYKTPKKLSECVKIMSFMKKDNHVDPELFELFLSSGVYKQYAEAFLLPEQIDEVDIGQYLPKAAE